MPLNVVPKFSRPQDIADILGTERNDAADSARAVDIRSRTAHDVHAAEQFRFKEEAAIRVVAAALVVLPCAIDDNGDTSKILQAANIDRRFRSVAAILKRYTRDIVKYVRQPFWLQASIIVSSVMTLTGASASMARSCVFDAATVMVSSDWTAVLGT